MNLSIDCVGGESVCLVGAVDDVPHVRQRVSNACKVAVLHGLEVFLELFGEESHPQFFNLAAGESWGVAALLPERVQKLLRPFYCFTHCGGLLLVMVLRIGVGSRIVMSQPAATPV
ncbi:hypothetical protein A5N75_08240 [Prescottella equi]|nr:hypothetical protein A5N75_08240 [Prescottella equi]